MEIEMDEIVCPSLSEQTIDETDSSSNSGESVDCEADVPFETVEYSQMLIERLPKWGFPLSLVGFLGLVVVLAAIGNLSGPPAWNQHSFSSWQCLSPTPVFDRKNCTGFDMDGGDSWHGSIRGMARLNQEMSLVATIPTPQNLTFGDDDDAINLQMSVTIVMLGTDRDDLQECIIPNVTRTRNLICRASHAYCDNITLVYEPFLIWFEYDVAVQMSLPDYQDLNLGVGDVIFTFKYINDAYTLFELWWRFCFLLVAFSAIATLTFKLRTTSWSEWKSEQKWIAVLLFGLMVYNNPLFALEMLVQGPLFRFIDILFSLSFISLLLFFFLVTLDSIRRGDGNKDMINKSFLRVHGLKVVLVGSMFALGLFLFGWALFYDLSDPEYSSPRDLPFFRFFYGTLLFLGVAYSSWLLSVIVQSCLVMQSVPHLRARIVFFVCFTLCVIMATLGGIAVSLYFPLFLSSTIFLASLAVFNSYTIIMAVLYLPHGTWHFNMEAFAKLFEDFRFTTDRPSSKIFVEEEDVDPLDDEVDKTNMLAVFLK